MSGHRYAIYFAPATATPLWRSACAWLGRDAATGARLPHPPLPDHTPERIAAITAAPRIYGFHATLKPPFRLSGERTPAELTLAVERFAARRAAFVVPRLTVAAVSNFLALAPEKPCPPLGVLAADCVRAFDHFRAPPDAAETARRRSAGLTPRQAALLERWGYPYVMDEFRFHMTLTGALPDGDRGRLFPLLDRHFAAVVDTPMTVDAVCLFEQPSAEEPFRIVARYPFQD